MNKIIKKDHDLTITVSDNKHFDWAYLHHLAVKAGHKKSKSDFKDEYFISFQWKDNEPHFIATLANGGLYSKGVYRITKIYSHVSVPIMIHKAQYLYLFGIMDDLPELECKLFFGCRPPGESKWAKIINTVDSTSKLDLDNVYMVGTNPNKKSTWHNIYYSGDISLLNVPTMTMREYNEI